MVDNPADILSEAAERKDDLPEQSCKRLPTQLPVLNEEYLGEQIPFELGGPGRQAKRAAMQLACGDRRTGRVRFSRMSGIQEWSDAGASSVGSLVYFSLLASALRSTVRFEPIFKCSALICQRGRRGVRKHVPGRRAPHGLVWAANAA